MQGNSLNLAGNTGKPFALTERQVASATGAHGQLIEVLRGNVWVTFEGRHDDYILAAGDRLPIDARGRVVIQGLAPSEVRLIRHSPITPGIRAARNVAPHPADCWRNFIGGLSTGRLNIDSPV